VQNRSGSITAIFYLDFIHRPYVLQPQRFKGCFFPRHQVKPTLLGPIDRASLYRWTFRQKHLDTEWLQFCSKLSLYCSIHKNCPMYACMWQNSESQVISYTATVQMEPGLFVALSKNLNF
jgi:hypothetical protein